MCIFNKPIVGNSSMFLKLGWGRGALVIIESRSEMAVFLLKSYNTENNLCSFSFLNKMPILTSEFLP